MVVARVVKVVIVSSPVTEAVSGLVIDWAKETGEELPKDPPNLVVIPTTILVDHKGAIVN